MKKRLAFRFLASYKPLDPPLGLTLFAFADCGDSSLKSRMRGICTAAPPSKVAFPAGKVMQSESEIYPNSVEGLLSLWEFLGPLRLAVFTPVVFFITIDSFICVYSSESVAVSLTT